MYTYIHKYTHTHTRYIHTYVFSFIHLYTHMREGYLHVSIYIYQYIDISFLLLLSSRVTIHTKVVETCEVLAAMIVQHFKSHAIYRACCSHLYISYIHHIDGYIHILM